MPRHHVRAMLTVLTLASGLAAYTVAVGGQVGTKNGEWPTYAGDTGSTRYAPLDQINAANFSTLELAWRFKTDALGPRPEFKLEATPLMVKGVVYSTAGTRTIGNIRGPFCGWHHARSQPLVSPPQSRQATRCRSTTSTAAGRTSR